jgi:hypothetical protein
MIRSFVILVFASLFLVACSTSQPAAPPSASVDPVTDPSIVGAVDEALLEGALEAEAAERTARRVGRVAGVLAAVFGGPPSETVDETVDRYRRTRDAVELTGLAIAATKGAVEGAQRGYQMDLQFAELHQIEGVEVMRPFPDEIEARFTSTPSEEMLAAIAAVFVGREERAIDIDAPGDAAMDLREALIDLGVPGTSLAAHRNERVQGVVLRIRYLD